VKTLCTLGYVSQCPDRSYRASLKIWKLGTMVMNHTNLAQLATTAMNSLAQATGESVHLSVRDGLKVLYIEKIDSAQSVRAYTVRGGSAPLHCVATGKVLLAYNYDALRAPIAGTLEAFTPKTITTLKALDAEIASIRKTGLAINAGEYRADVGGIAAPILDDDGNVLAAIGISGPLSRLPRTKIIPLIEPEPPSTRPRGHWKLRPSALGEASVGKESVTAGLFSRYMTPAGIWIHMLRSAGPASSRVTRAPPSASRAATTQPAVPPPTTTYSLSCKCASRCTSCDLIINKLSDALYSRFAGPAG